MISRFAPAIVCGFAAAVLMMVPGVKFFACCLILPAAAAMALFLDQRVNGVSHIRTSKGVALGLITGLYAALFATVFEGLFSYFVRTNDVIQSLPQYEKLLRDLAIPNAEEALKSYRQMAEDIRKTGFSAFYMSMMAVGYSFMNSIAGLIGGIAGAAYLNKRNSEPKGPDHD